MITTTRIASGFDIELQLGGGWFTTTLRALDSVADTPVGIISVEVTVDDPGFQLRILTGLGADLGALSISDDGSELTLTTQLSGTTLTIPFGAVQGFAGPPVLALLAGDTEHENVIAVLGNLVLQVEPQSEEPGLVPVPRGDPAAAVSFLPLGQHVAFGMGKATYERIANNLWHTKLRAEDGTHPLPDAENNRGQWEVARMSASGGAMHITMEGDISEFPGAVVLPDPRLTITLTLIPTLTADGRLVFEIGADSDVDTGLLGDLFAGIVGGLVGFGIGLLTGNPIAGAIGGFVTGIVVLELVEFEVEGIVRRGIQAKIDGTPVNMLCNHNGIVQVAIPPAPEDGFNLSLFSTIPSSIVLQTSRPAGELLFQRSLLVRNVYGELAVDANGFAAAGTSEEAERFLPFPVTLVDAIYTGTELTSLTFERSPGVQQVLSFDEAVDRAAHGELEAPFKLFEPPAESTFRIPEGKLACVCLTPVAIHRENTIVEQIEFQNGVVLNVPDAIRLQDHSGMILLGFQLIHPRDIHAYYRAKADHLISNNFEELPVFGP